MKLKLKSGQRLMLPSVDIWRNNPATILRVSSYAFLVPPPDEDVRSLNEMCSDLKVLFNKLGHYVEFMARELFDDKVGSIS